MGEKKKGNQKGGDGEKKDVLKFHCLCDGCAPKILKRIHELEGVDTVNIETAVDPAAIKEKLLKKTKKKVDLISPQPKKDDNKEEKKEKKPDKEKNQDSDNKQEKKPKEGPVTTANLKVQLKCPCDRCIVKLLKFVSKTKGVQECKIDEQKELVTVKGTMDVKALAEALKKKLMSVEIVPPKKEKDGNNEGGENGGGGGKKKNKGGNNGGDGGNEANAGGGGGGGRMEGNRMEVMVQPGFGYMPGYPESMPGYTGYGHPHHAHPACGYGYGHPNGHGHGHAYAGYVPGYPVSVNPPHQMFNDENPNACAIL